MLTLLCCMYFIFIEVIGVTSVNKVVQVAHAQFHSASPVY